MKLKRYINFINEMAGPRPSNKSHIDNQGRRVYDGSIKVVKRQVRDGKLFIYPYDIITGDFDCSDSGLISLEGGPTKVNGDFECQRNNLTSLEGGPTEVNGYFNCSMNELTSLKGSPTKVGKHFQCLYITLTSLESNLIKAGGGLMIDRSLDLKIEENYIYSGNNIGDYWTGLLKYMLDRKINLTEVKGWPEGFLNSNSFKSIKGVQKFDL